MRDSSRIIGRIALALFVVAVLACLAKEQVRSSNCQGIAARPPFVPLGGAATIAPRDTELSLAVGSAGPICPTLCGHEGFSDWLARWRCGVSNRINLGFDFEVENHSRGEVGGTIKVATRYQGGVGTSHAESGRSVNADLASTIDTPGPKRRGLVRFCPVSLVPIVAPVSFVPPGATKTTHQAHRFSSSVSELPRAFLTMYASFWSLDRVDFSPASTTIEADIFTFLSACGLTLAKKRGGNV